MRVLAITKIFPNSLEPLSSPFNRQQFVELAKICELNVIEAIPYVPFAGLTGQPKRAAMLSKLPKQERVEGIETHYMRQLYVPRIGLSIAMPLYLASLAPFRSFARKFDVIFATWAYPDGCASTLFAERLGIPCVVKVHGSDVNVVAQTKVARSMMGHVLPRANAMVAVSRPLADELHRIGVARDRLHVVANGVNTTLFYPRDRAEARAKLSLPPPSKAKVILFVGRLEPQKGTPELLDAFARVKDRVPEAVLALIGEGVSRPLVNEAKARFGNALIAPGARPLTEVAEWVAACDVFTLPSHNEGTPNVVLEALASGRPAVATTVGGIPDVLSDLRSGLLVPPRDPEKLADALVQALTKPWDPESIRACGPGSWADSAKKLLDLFASVRASSGR